jgi:hypothetical protein
MGCYTVVIFRSPHPSLGLLIDLEFVVPVVLTADAFEYQGLHLLFEIQDSQSLARSSGYLAPCSVASVGKERQGRVMHLAHRD